MGVLMEELSQNPAKLDTIQPPVAIHRSLLAALVTEETSKTRCISGKPLGNP
jgi:hypothetical protein